MKLPTITANRHPIYADTLNRVFDSIADEVAGSLSDVSAFQRREIRKGIKAGLDRVAGVKTTAKR